jgi:hypothetical protein
MQVSRVTAIGALAISMMGALALGTELPKPAAGAAAHRITETAPELLINNPRLAGLLTESAQRAFLPLKHSSNDLAPQPAEMQTRGATVPSGLTPGTWAGSNHPLAFNNDLSGYPQNEESVAACNAGTDVLGAWTDFRNAPSNGDQTGWGISTDSGHSLRNSNFLPGVTVKAGSSSGPGSGTTSVYGGSGSAPASGGGREYLSTQGSAVIRASSSCSVYASSLAFMSNFSQPFASAVVVDLSNTTTLKSCSTETSCWPTRKVVALSTNPFVYYDKDSLAVDPTPAGYVWVGFTRYSFDQYGNAIISAVVVRCSALLTTCSQQIVLESDVSFGPNMVVPTWTSIAVGTDGRAYVSWATVNEPFGGGQPTVQVNEASAAGGSTKFGTPVQVTDISLPVLNPFASENFSINGFPSIAVSHLGVDRVSVVYAECRNTDVGLCEHSEVLLATSQTGAVGTWSIRAIAAAPVGSDFFPAVTADAVTGNVLVGFWSTRFDPGQSSFDVVAVPVNPATGAASPAIRVTAQSIEPDNDPFLGAQFIGSYWELAAYNGQAWAHYTSTQRLQRVLGQGIPIPQQDNVLSAFGF